MTSAISGQEATPSRINFRILGRHLVFFEDRIARLVDREQVWIDGVTLGVAHAFRLFETNPHQVSSSDGSGSMRIGR